MDFRFHQELIEYRTHYRWGVIIVSIIFIILASRFFYLQILEGETFENLATVSHVVRERLIPNRGIIKVRTGEILATNIEAVDLMVVPQYVKDERPVTLLKELGVLTYDEANEIWEMIKKLKNTEQGIQRIVAKKNLTTSRCPFDLIQMRFNPTTKKMVCPKCKREMINQTAVVQAHLFELQGFSLRERRVRYYPEGKLTAHVVGFVNEVTKDEIERSTGKLRQGDLIGRSGVEKMLDSCLRGKPGEDVYVRNAGGRRIEMSSLPDPFKDINPTQPVPGCDLTLTIDLALQTIAMELLSQYHSGAIVVMDPNNGEILAMASHPSFDPNQALLLAQSPTEGTDPFYAPYLNKAVTAYPPGSVFKLITAIAGLNEGIITDEDMVFCQGSYEFKGRRFKCHKHSGHGKVAMVDAISKSCDVYFYTLGEKLGLDNLAHYARDVFGLGERTYIEITEAEGLIPTERWYYRHGKYGLQPGFALNTAVGQGDVKVTPLQMARAYSALVNGGVLVRPRLIAKIEMADGQVLEGEKEVQRLIDIPDVYLEIVRMGMHKAVNDTLGTAYPARIRELPFAGKTGTAQASERRKEASPEQSVWLTKDHAWFVGYAPSKKPKIVVVVFIEHGGFGGQVAAPIAKKIIETFYSLHPDEFSDEWDMSDEDNILQIIK